MFLYSHIQIVHDDASAVKSGVKTKGRFCAISYSFENKLIRTHGLSPDMLTREGRCLG